MHYYTPGSELGFRSRKKKKKPKANSKNSQSLFSVILTVNHGLVSLHTNAKVNISVFPHLDFTWACCPNIFGSLSRFYFLNISHECKRGQSPSHLFLKVRLLVTGQPGPSCVSPLRWGTGCCCGGSSISAVGLLLPDDYCDLKVDSEWVQSCLQLSFFSFVTEGG